MADAFRLDADPQLVLFANDTISVKTFHNQDEAAKKEALLIKFLCFDNAGSLWGIDQDYRLLQFNISKSNFTLYHAASLEPGEEVNGMTPDGDSAFYVCTNKSLVRLNRVNGYTENLTAFLPSANFLTIANDPDNKEILWIGTLSDGLIRFDKSSKKTKAFSVATGLPNNTIYGILPGNDHLFWCSSNKGIFAFDKNNQTIRSFTSRDGLSDEEFNRYCYLALPDSNLAFGGSLGYTLFKPSRLKTDEFDPQVILTGLNVINRGRLDDSLNTIKELHLRHDQNFITAEFAAMQFDFPEKIQYRYMLTGFDKTWILPGNGNRVSYTSLPPGNYELLLNASNTSGKWSSYTRSIKIIISPPFWETWWFYVSMAALIVLVIYLFLSVRIRSIKKRHAQKLHFERKAMELHAMALRARMNPHFIFNCLNSIKALIQEQQDKKAVSYLNTFVTLIRKQLNNTNNEIALQDELETCRLYLQLEAMRFDGRINFQFHIDEKDELLGETRIPPLILQPIVENSVVHGLLPREEGGLIMVSIYRVDTWVVCEIEDDGIGRAAAAIYRQKSSRLHQSKGLHLLEERITMHNHLNEGYSSLETIDLFDKDGHASGTRVIIKFNAEI